MTQARSALNWLLNKHHTVRKAADSTYNQPVPHSLSKKDTTVSTAFRQGVQVTRRRKQKTVSVAAGVHGSQPRPDREPNSEDEGEEGDQEQNGSPIKLSDPLKGKIRRMIPAECMKRAMRW